MLRIRNSLRGTTDRVLAITASSRETSFNVQRLDARTSAKACIQVLRTGTTDVNDNRGLPFDEYLPPFANCEEAWKEGILNLGLKDILVALRWIKTHIREFGGDPDKVTVFGESAGARAIEILLLDGHLKDLVRGAIIQSSVTVPTVPPTIPGRDSVWNAFINSTKCTDVSHATCTNWFPNLDNKLILTYPSVMKTESAKGISVMVGANLDEATFITPQAISSTEQVRAMLTALLSPSPRGTDALSESIDKTLDLYPDIASLGSPFGTGNEIFGLKSAYKRYAAIVTDLLVHANRRMFLTKLNKAGIKTYSYLFTDPDAASVFPPEFIIQTPKPGSFGESSTSRCGDSLPVFGTIAQENNTKVASSAAGILGLTRPIWPVYSKEEVGNVTHILQLEGGKTRAIADDFRERQIAFFNEDSVMWSR
ncbi:hypothetical protein VNI00_007255 [Paramarasmius palmivorus]|uniref:Carboxylic ester hydrolase n=1 Tax=Paramarasmius palmivorus TaxID=297713 RepID=A0AAW0D0D6_9AGAR